MKQLPTEVVFYIFELAMVNDSHTACQLCLVNQSVRKIAQPLLYKHVCLSNTDKIKSFNATIGSHPKLGDLIHGITLSGHIPSPNSLFESEDDLIKYWKKLIRYMGVLSRQHSLKTLILLDDTLEFLCFDDEETKENLGDIEMKTLGDILRQSKLQLDHLVISHHHSEFFLNRINTKKLTWCGCDFSVTSGALDFDEYTCPRWSKQLEEVSFMISDNYDRMHSDEDGHHYDDEDNSVGLRGPLSWPVVLAAKIQRLCETQTKTPKFSIFLHVQTQEAKKQLVEELKGLEFEVIVGEWGKTSDTSQAQAQLEIFANKGWIQKELSDLTSKTEEAENSKDDDFRDNPEVSSRGWLMRRPPGKQWCGCIDLEGQWDDEGDEEDEEDGEDYLSDGMGDHPSWDAWSDNSDNWDPMQRMAFRSGESHHYSQAYLDRYAL